ncbi:zinc finger protein Xfin-like [Zerene cesonia]|uniref:zinc finger protein Xfin-like n=1 Tax=Zerene cesonia TaxID=33412 RepID=UPI0018E59FD9|nr:zinc finger protein Xfin-like [Zerene cesonia]
MKNLQELIYLLIDTKISKLTCFMCFKKHEKIMNICEYVHIDCGWFATTLSLKALTDYIFPLQNMILTQACNPCIDMLISTYITIRKKEYVEKYLTLLINKINEQLLFRPIPNQKLYIETELKNNFKVKCSEGPVNIDNIQDFNESNEIEEGASCPKCYKYIQKNQLKSHMRLHKHRQRKTYSCDICDYKTKCKTTLEGHKNNKHYQKRPHKCSTCEKSFYTKSALAEHIKTHRQTKDIICEICGDSFYHSKSLKDHLKLHLNDKTYECYVCNHRFVNLSRVNNHMKQKHGEKKEFCVVCGKRFVFKKDMRRHMKLVHKQMDLNVESIQNSTCNKTVSELHQ